ncbi:MAG: hypothetical protein ABSG90_11605 [Dehalococcoidia bacterium]|jgi:hypothetical protein
MPPILNIIGTGGAVADGFSIWARWGLSVALIGKGGGKGGGPKSIFSTKMPAVVIGAGGAKAGGSSVFISTLPSVLHIIGAGGATADGQGIFVSKRPGVLVGAGGAKAGGVGVFVSTLPAKPSAAQRIGTGGAKAGGASIFISVIPTILRIIGLGGAKVGLQTALPTLKSVLPSQLAAPGPTLIVGGGGAKGGGTGVFSGIIPSTLNLIGVGGAKAGVLISLPALKSVIPAQAQVGPIVGTGGGQGGGAGVWSSTTPPASAFIRPGAGEEATAKAGGRGAWVFIDPQILEIIGEGGALGGGAGPPEVGVYDTYALTGGRDEPSIYSGFNFNSYARLHGRYYGAGPAGISLLEGDDDAGAKIHAGVRLNPFNMGSEREKRLRIVRCGGETRGAQVKVSSNGCANYADVHDSVAQVDRSVQGRELVLEITGFKTLDHLEIVPVVLAKR